MIEDFRLTIRSDPRLLAAVRCLVRAWVERNGFDANEAGRIVLAIDEACSNAIRHAYEGRCHESMELRLRSDPKALELILCDHGSPCAKDKSAPRKLETPTPDNLRPGGLGVQLIHEVFDEVDFRSGSPRGNCVTMRLQRRTPWRIDEPRD